MFPKSASIMLIIVVLVSCSNNTYYDPGKAHHTPDGFRNIHYDDSKNFIDFIVWKWGQLSKDIQSADSYEFPVDRSQHRNIRTNTSRPSLTWIGHATFLIQIDGMNILTDPHFSERASPVSWAGPRRAVPPAMPIRTLPEIDAVVISHDHYDSLDVSSVKDLAKHNAGVHFLVPLGMKAWFDALELSNIQVTELDWGESHTISNIRFTAEPSQHWGKRSLFDGFERLWASWVIRTKDRQIFFAGDSGYTRHFKNIGEKYGFFDLALIPIGAYAPRWFMQHYHANPEEAVLIHRDIRSRYSVAMHWGTFIMTDEPLDEPPVRLADALQKYAIKATEFEVYRHGESRFLENIWQ